MALVRVIVQHSPTIYGLLGLVEESECAPALRLKDRTYYRCQSTPRWVFYKHAVQGHGEAGQPGDERPVFNPDQR